MATKGRLFLVLPFLLLLALGCKKGGASARVHGKVTYKGTPVTAGTVTFQPKEGGGLYPVPIQADGTYAARDLPYGEMVVTIETESANPKPKPTMMDYRKDRMGKVRGGNDTKKPVQMTSPTPKDAPKAEQGKYVRIPVKYGSKDQSGLAVNLTSGNQEENFNLTD